VQLVEHLEVVSQKTRDQEAITDVPSSGVPQALPELRLAEQTADGVFELLLCASDKPRLTIDHLLEQPRRWSDDNGLLLPERV
jgi:hypothetical protein